MRKAPDIPQNVFFEDAPAAEAAETATPQAVKQSSGQDGKPASGQAVKQSKRQAVKTASSQKVQVTFYLGDEAAKELERLRYELLAQHDVRASRSAIVEAAILGVGVGERLEGLAERLGE